MDHRIHQHSRHNTKNGSDKVVNMNTIEKMSDQEENDEINTSPSPAKKVRHRQGQPKSTENLYLKPKFADVHFAFASNDGTLARVPAHKNLLAADSDVFEKMFYGESKENGDVTITDASEAVFEEFLQFFYVCKMKLTTIHIPSILYLGLKYNVKKCIDGCVKIMQNDLTHENVCTTLSLAIRYNQKDLLKACERLIILNTIAVFQSTGFCHCDEKSLTHILRMDLLSCSEVDVFEACMAWVQGQSKQNTLSKALVEEHLGALYYEIRFVSMTIQEFCALDTKYKDVLSDDFNTIVRIITESPVELNPFNIIPRQIKWNEDAVLKCNRAFGDDIMMVNFRTKRELQFSTNQPLIFGQFVCSKIGVRQPVRDLSSHLSVDVEITEGSVGAIIKSLVKMKVHLGSKDTIVSLPHPVLIRPGLIYTICIGPFPDAHFFYTKELKTKMQLDTANIHIQFYKCTANTLNRKVTGLISALNFNHIQ